MKLYLDYKKLSRILFVFFILLMPFGIFPPLRRIAGEAILHAQTAEEIQNKINQKNADISNLEKEIAAYQSELDGIGQQKSTLSSSLKELDLTRKKLNADIAVTQNKIDKTNLTIKSLSSDISNKQENITNNIESISIGIRSTNEFEQSSLLGTLLSQRDFTEMWNDLDNIVTLSESIRKNIVELKQVKGELEGTRKETIDAKNELVALKSKLADQQKIVIQNTNEKNQLLKQTKNNEANYQKLLKDRLLKVEAFEKDLRDYESQLKFVLNPDELPGSGVLSWPLDNIYVTQVFGKTVASKRLYVSGSHGGVDFKASIGTPVRAMADGEVLGTGNTDDTCVGTSFGKWVFIKYNNGLASTYGHLSLIKAQEGQKVTRGDIVAYSGATGHVTGPHLHVAVYVSSAVSVQKRPSTACNGKVYTMPIAPTNAYLDPLFYLPSLSTKLISPKGQSIYE